MSCNICSKLPNLPKEEVNITINLIDKTFKDILDDYLTDDIDYNYISPTIIQIHARSLEDFILNLCESNIFNDKIMETIMITYTKEDKNMIDGIKNFTSLSNLYYLIKSKDLINVLEKNSLDIHFQPIIDLKSNEIYGYECLLRGKKLDGANYPPFQMFEVAKKNDLIFFLDRTARQLALKKASEYNIEKKIFINLMPSAIYDPKNCLKSTVNLARELGFDEKNIVFEIVESEKAESTEKLKSILDYYKENGFKVALDDMGKGYSTLNLLSQLLPDIMEIIRDIYRDSLKQSVFNALIDIANEHNIKTLAEGIEVKEELDFVKSRGIDYAQGYLFSPPTNTPVKNLELRLGN